MPEQVFSFRPLDLTKARFSDEIVKQTFLLMQSNRITITQMSKRAGLSYRTLVDWKKGVQPTIGNVRAVLQAMGKDLVIVDKT